MFGLFSAKKSLVKSGFFRNFTDHHCHILAGVDDGMRRLSRSLEALDYYESLGVSRVVLTPHVMVEPSVDNQQFLDAYALLRESYRGPIKLLLASEYMLDSGYMSHLKDGDYRCLTDNMLLVETSYVSAPNNLSQLLFETQSIGLRPIIAHPERYTYMEIGDYRDLVDNGCGLQLNLLSLSGFYGGKVVDKALYMLDNNMYNCVGSDMHNLAKFQQWINQVKLTKNQLASLEVLKLGLF